MIDRMKAAVLAESHQPLVVTEVKVPARLSFGQVLVKVHFSGICGAQINEIDAVKGPDKFLPHLLGHEGVGTVLEIGPGVTTVKPGDRVCLHWRPGDGIQSNPPKYEWDGGQLNAGWVTTFNDHAVVSENRLTCVPEDFPIEQVPLLGCAVTTAMGVINNDAHVKIGQSVVVFGVGGVGLNIIQFASLVAAHPIIGVDVVESKREMGMRFGATACFNALTTPHLDNVIREIVGPHGADVVIETTGNGRVIEQAYELTHPDGKTILVGVPRKDDRVCIYTLPLHFKKVLTGSHGGSCEPHIDIPRVIRLWRAGKVNFDGIITHRFPLQRINEAIRTVRSGAAGRVLVVME